MRLATQLADELQLPMYLEATSNAVPLYLKHGCEDGGDGDGDGIGEAHVVTGMMRGVGGV